MELAVFIGLVTLLLILKVVAMVLVAGPAAYFIYDVVGSTCTDRTLYRCAVIAVVLLSTGDLSYWLTLLAAGVTFGAVAKLYDRCLQRERNP